MAVARVMGVRGLKGDLRVMALTDVPNRLIVGTVVLVEGEEAPRRITQVGTTRLGPVLRLEGISDHATATALIGRHLTTTEPPAPLPTGTFWWHELEGLEVVTREGQVLGRLEEVFRVGANEVYRVIGPDAELLVPALRSVVLDIDLDGGRMTIRHPSDWLEDV